MGLYKKPIWQCESTGKSNLTYKQALESEKVEKERVQDKLPEQLQKRVLMHIQFRKQNPHRIDTELPLIELILLNRNCSFGCRCR
jgi:hypothetical protein